MQPQQYREARSHEDCCVHAVRSKLLCPSPWCVPITGSMRVRRDLLIAQPREASSAGDAMRLTDSRVMPRSWIFSKMP